MNILFVNQNYAPDLSATSQYLTDVAEQLANEGHRVTILCSRHSYLDGTILYKKNETINNVAITRIWSPLLRRTTSSKRILQALLYNLIFLLRYILLPKHDIVVVLTSPPLLHWAIACGNIFKRAKLIHWAMDINPEQTIIAGWIQSPFLISLLKRLNAFFLSLYSKVIVLDTFMKETMVEAKVPTKKIVICPLWYSEEKIFPLAHEQNTFRATLPFSEKCIVMFAGNHSICHPLTTLLETARQLREEEQFHFLFVGGGARYSEVTHFKTLHNLENISQLGYQETERLNELLNTADIHIVPMGRKYVGLVHPSKIYCCLALEKPIISIGPSRSSVVQLTQGLKDTSHTEENNVEEVIHFLKMYAAEGSQGRTPTKKYEFKKIFPQFLEVMNIHS